MTLVKRIDMSVEKGLINNKYTDDEPQLGKGAERWAA